jgi:hypothetical protein
MGVFVMAGITFVTLMGVSGAAIQFSWNLKSLLRRAWKLHRDFVMETELLLLMRKRE